MMKAFSNFLRGQLAILIGCTLPVVGIIFMLVPPPQAARAFEAQSTWGGAGGGTANAQTVAIANVTSLNDVLGVPLRYIPAADNTGPATISVNGLTATAVRRPSNIGLVALSSGELQAGVTTEIMYNGTTIEIRGPLDMTPIGKSVEFRGSATPRGTLIEDGSCVSRTTYAPLFSVVGTNYGACDGTTTFGLPDSRGRGFIALDNQGANGAANVVTSGGSGCNATAVGNCGAQNATLTLAQLPTGITAANASQAISVSTAGNAHPNLVGTAGSVGGVQTLGGSQQASPATTAGGIGDYTAVTSMAGSNSISVTSNNTSGAAHPILNPVSLGRRAIKF